MISFSLLEQLTNNVSLSMLGIVSVGILTLVLIYNFICRCFFSSTKEENKVKQIDSKNSSTEVSTGQKKKHSKPKKNLVTAPQTPSEPSEKKKFVSSSSQKPISDSLTKNEATEVSNDKSEKIDVTQNNMKKKKKVTINLPEIPSTKQQKSSRNEINKKKNVNVQKIPIQNVVSDVFSDTDQQQNEGQWLIQTSKQINHRQRNKIKNDLPSPPVIGQEIKPKKTTTVPTVVSADETKPKVETTMTSVMTSPPPQPIEIIQLIPQRKDRYTSNDIWWKQIFNKPRKFSVADLGEWPEREDDEQYIVQVKQILPVKKLSTSNE